MTGAVPNIDIRPDHWRIVRDILARHVPDREVWAFGSRATWTAKEYSDLDLAILGERPLPPGVRAALEEDFSESDLPYKVDLVEWAGLGEGFRAIVKRDRVVAKDKLLSNSMVNGMGIRSIDLDKNVYPADVKPRMLSECIGGDKRVIGGPFGSNLTQADYSSSGVPVIRGGNMGKNGRWIGGDFAYVPQEKVNNTLSSNIARRGDIIVTQRGTMGQVSIIPDESSFEYYVISQSQMAIHVDRECASRDFVYYYLISPAFENYLKQSTIQTGVPHINLGILRRTPVCWPDVNSQRKIATFLSAFDAKIELNRQMNETLEAMARQLFRDWFVDFGPTRAKMEGHAPYLPSDLWSLFPDRLDDDGTPEGWASISLDRIGKLNTSAINPLLSPSECFEHFSLPAYDGNKKVALDYGNSIKSNKTLVPNGAILLSKLNPEIERVWITGENKAHRRICSTEFLAFSPIDYGSVGLLYGLFTDTTFREMLKSTASGTSNSHQRVLPSKLMQTVVLVGSPEIMAQYGLWVAPWLKKVLGNREESETLATLRDALLPKLMSGEIRVREAEKLVEAVL